VNTISHPHPPGKTESFVAEFIAKIPPELRDLRRWVCWKNVHRKGDKKPTKQPRTLTGAMASSTDPKTWDTLARVIDACQYRPETVDGIGIVLGKMKDGRVLTGIDLDLHDGKLPDGADQIVTRRNSYAEYSPGGGIHILGWGTPFDGTIKGGGFERYCKDRYFTFTGNRIDGAPLSLANIDHELDLVAKFITESKASAKAKRRAVHNTNNNGMAIQDRERRCQKYIGKMPSAISGQGGHDATFAVACELYRFGLDDGTASAILNDYNARCSPPWSDAELAHKLKSAKDEVSADGEFGCRLTEKNHRATGNGPTRKAASKPVSNDIPVKASEPGETIDDHGVDDDAGAGDAVEDADNLTEMGNCDRLLRAHANDIRFVPGLGWFLWNGNRWVPDELGGVIEMMKRIVRDLWRTLADALDRKELVKFVTESERHAKIMAAINLAKTDPRITVAADKLDADAMLAGTPGGVVDLRTGKHRPGQRGDLISKTLSVDPADTPDCTLFLAFLDRIFAGNAELISYIQRLLGMFLTGDISEQSIWFFIGGGANGKSVLIDLVLHILGDYGTLAPPDLFAARPHGTGHPCDLAFLFGTRLAVVSETPSGAAMELSRMKALTGDMKITARKMRQDFVTVGRTHKNLMVTNHPPRIKDGSEAVWRRLQKVPFDVTIPAGERDPKLLAKLKREAPGILRWMIDGCIHWQRNGLNPPAIVVQATEQYKDSETPGGDYISDRLKVTPRARLPREVLYQDYQSYSVQNGDKFPMEKAELFAAIRAIPGVRDTKWKAIGTSATVRGFCGIELAAVASVAPGGTTSRYFSITDSHEDSMGNDATRCHPATEGDGKPELTGDYDMAGVEVRR
jgi:putative DNA primase/helicase